MTQGLTGEPDLRPYDEQPNGSTVPLRTSDGRIKAAAPVDGNDVVRKADIPTINSDFDWAPGFIGPRSTQLSATSGDAQTYAIGKSADGSVLVAILARASAVPKVYVSVDTGYTWKQTAALTGNAYGQVGRTCDVYVQDASNFALVWCDDSANVLRFATTINGGASWTVRSSASVGTATNFSVAIVSMTTAWYAYTVTSPTSTIKYGTTANAGSTFTIGTVATETFGNYGTSVAAASATEIFVAWCGSGALVRFGKTANTGNTWSTPATIVSNSAGGIGDFGLVAKNASVLILFYAKTGTVRNRAIMATADGGSTWTQTFDSATQPISQISSQGEVAADYDPAANIFMVAYVGSTSSANFRLLISNDGGQTWTQRNTTTPINGALSSVLIGGRPIVNGTYAYVLWYNNNTAISYWLQEIRKVLMA